MASVLVVDDDNDSREYLARYLARAGLAVQQAPNGREALHSILNELPDVIVLDVRMPEMDGIELMQLLHAYLRWAALPVVLLTAYPTGPHIDSARQLGMKCLFEKANFRLAELLACVQRLATDPTDNCVVS